MAVRGLSSNPRPLAPADAVVPMNAPAPPVSPPVPVSAPGTEPDGRLPSALPHRLSVVVPMYN